MKTLQDLETEYQCLAHKQSQRLRIGAPTAQIRAEMVRVGEEIKALRKVARAEANATRIRNAKAQLPRIAAGIDRAKADGNMPEVLRLTGWAAAYRKVLNPKNV